MDTPVSSSVRCLCIRPSHSCLQLSGAPSQKNRLLITGKPFYFLFLHGTCVSNRKQQVHSSMHCAFSVRSQQIVPAYLNHRCCVQAEPIETSCFELNTAGAGEGFGKYVKMYTSAHGVTLSAALRHDYLGVGYPNAPGTTNGRDDSGTRDTC